MRILTFIFIYIIRTILLATQKIINQKNIYRNLIYTNIFHIGIRTYYTYTKRALFQYFTALSETYILLSRSACGRALFR